MNFAALIFLPFIFIFSQPIEARISSKRIELTPAIRNELNLILQNTNQLHSACINDDEGSIEKATEKVINSLKRATKNSSMAQVQATHLVKILSAALEKLEVSQNYSGQKRRDSLLEAFKDLVQIAQVYKLEKYNIFFCNKDKALWLQKSSMPKNPINPKKFGKCGRLVQ
ncbi:MAG: DUF3347 domain-containing protein [Bdellovibrionales bacterium]|nr:DUF3347 domain-containing protein [Bdellovibrionales bacterium]